MTDTRALRSETQHLRRLFLFLGGCVLVAALVSPWIYLAVQWAVKTWGGEPWKYLSKHPFHRYFNRVLQGSMLIGIWGHLRRAGFLSWEALGLGRDRSLLLLGAGFGSSLVFLGAYAGVVGWYGGQAWEPTHAMDGMRALGFLLKVGVTAWIVSLAEEIFFRGYFYRLCCQETGPSRALWINILLFSTVHYLKPSQPFSLSSEDVHWYSGFMMMGNSLEWFSKLDEIVGGLLVLMMVAWILCWSLDRTKSLYLAIGLHAGWIMVLQINSELTRPMGSNPVWLFGGGNLSQGVWTLVPLGLQFLLLRKWLRTRRGER